MELNITAHIRSHCVGRSNVFVHSKHDELAIQFRSATVQHCGHLGTESIEATHPEIDDDHHGRQHDGNGDDDDGDRNDRRGISVQFAIASATATAAVAAVVAFGTAVTAVATRTPLQTLSQHRGVTQKHGSVFAVPLQYQKKKTLLQSACRQ